MREILFRGKTYKGEWVQGVPFVEEERCYIIEDLFICYEYDCTGAVNSMVLPETVGQYTGFTDKNGKKIFEGDIVAWCDKETLEDETSYIGFDEDICCFTQVYSDHYSSVLYKTNELRVIGNIHDNPELLKGATDE